MRIRKSFYILIAFILFFVSFVYAETEQDRISFIFSPQHGEICLTTSAIPNQYFSIKLPDGIESQDLFNMIRPEIIPRVIDCFVETIMARNNQNAKEKQKGFFSGDLFEQASEKQEIDLSKEDMQLLLNDLISRIQGKEIDAETKASIERIMQLFIRQICEEDRKVKISTYDQGRYLTLNIAWKQDTILIISADLSEKDTYRIVIGRGTDNAVYYDEISCKQNGMETDWVFSLYRTMAPSFGMVNEQDCVQFAEVRITDLNNKAVHFEGEIHSVLLPVAAGISGEKPAGEEEISIEIYIGKNKEEITEVLIPILDNLMTP